MFKFETTKGFTHIYVGKPENELKVLVAIVKASFELACPVGMGYLGFRNRKLTTEEAEKLISFPDTGKTIIEMDWYEGRLCRTYIDMLGNGHYTLLDLAYDMHRGTPDTMLERAKQILSGEDTEPVSSTHMFVGKNLTLRLKHFCFDRKPEENDWDFRKRVFPDIFQENPITAIEFLLGYCAVDWIDLDKNLIQMFLSQSPHNRASLKNFAEGWADDPINMRDKKPKKMLLQRSVGKR